MSQLSNLSKISQFKLPSNTTYALIDLDGRSMIAANYATAVAYSANDYVIYQDDLYRITADITSSANTGWAVVSKVVTTVGNEIKRVEASITGGIHYRGYTTTALTDGATTNPITIDGNPYTAVAGDLVIATVSSKNLEFIFDGTIWNEFGSSGALKAMAFADTASGSSSVTVSGTTSGVNVTMTVGSGNKTSITPFATGGSFTQGTDTFSAGTASTFTQGEDTFSAGTASTFSQGSDTFTQGSDTFTAGSYTVSNEILSITLPTFTQGTDSFTQGSDTFAAGTLPSFTQGEDTFAAGTLPSFTQGSDTFVAATGGTAVEALTSLPTPDVTQGTVSATGNVSITVTPDTI